MKCGYNQCVYGGDVEKDIAIKYNARYYHSKCYDKKIYKEKCLELLKDNGFMIKTINLALKKMIDDDKVEPQFVYFTVKYIFNNKLVLNNPFGVNYYLQNFNIIELYDKEKRMRLIKENRIKEVEIDNVDIPEFKHTSKPPKYLKIL